MELNLELELKVGFQLDQTPIKLKLKLELELKVGFPVDQTPIRVNFLVGLKVPNLALDRHRKAIEQV